ncbi:ADP-ribosylglycohydrolase family protein [Oleomonas cavernae]|uniref:ADP-ribosylglycohydrolase family protein n=1 Tax=Oleomonas cavernae TaxID=2320859 RepID=A0A418WA44_9PROT|nr:ADP-ribosylglycohydrolase family protein [Oleomonas cavernae]RJF86814.1 ADP-ribosylglycohydrolase family protein [Oleomonas cavernae]
MSAETPDRALGALLGLAVGDALGTTLEFRSRDSLSPLTDMAGGGPFGLSAGQWTDDTAMALALADSLLRSGGRIDKRDLLVRFVNWWQWGENSCTGTCFDIGIATRVQLRQQKARCTLWSGLFVVVVAGACNRRDDNVRSSVLISFAIPFGAK